VNQKNKYKVIKIINGNPVEHSSHNGFEYAEIQRDLQRKKGIASFITYRGEMVEQDVKKTKPQKEGI
jgi:hypothetical protein